ncbi:MAG: DUF2892 domain-containing protein [Methylococcales bacterium]|nr:DUF2892 domain-containing protein [Methylococcales bacterium]
MSFDYKRLVKFEINVGNKESKIRLIVGSVLFAISLFTASIILLLGSLILIATGYTNFCPVYSAMEKNTCEEGEKS